MEDPLARFGGRLQWAMDTWHLRHRKPKRLSDRGVAERVGKLLGGEPLDASTVWRWRQTDTKPPLETVEALAKVLDVPPGWLAFREGPGPDDSIKGWYEPLARPD